MNKLTGICRDGKGNKCGREAPYRLVGPDNLVVPGFMCREHAEECIREYAAKLGEYWTMLDIQTGKIVDIGICMSFRAKTAARAERI